MEVLFQRIGKIRPVQLPLSGLPLLSKEQPTPVGFFILVME